MRYAIFLVFLLKVPDNAIAATLCFAVVAAIYYIRKQR